MRVISYGGGVQSTAMLMLAGLGRLPVDAVLFDNVGEDSEAPETLEYVREIAVPWAREHGVPVHELHKTKRDGSTETVLGRVKREGGRSHVIPIKLSGGMQGGRSCTADFKVGVAGKWLQEHGAAPENPATLYMGISLDEIERANRRKAKPYERIEYPLLDLRWRRDHCSKFIREQRLSAEHTTHLRSVVDDLDWYVRDQLKATDCTMMPEPPKSACWFCPARPMDSWSTLAAERPERFEKVAALERWFIDREAAQGKPPVFFSNAGMPITDLVIPGVQLLPMLEQGDEACDSGWCMT